MGEYKYNMWTDPCKYKYKYISLKIKIKLDMSMDIIAIKSMLINTHMYHNIKFMVVDL